MQHAGSLPAWMDVVSLVVQTRPRLGLLVGMQAGGGGQRPSLTGGGRQQSG